MGVDASLMSLVETIYAPYADVMPKRKKEIVKVAVVLSDASPILTLSRIGRVDVLSYLDAPIHIVDQVHWEVTRPRNDPNGDIAAAFARMHNQIKVIETFVGIGFRTKRAEYPATPSKDLGELAVNEYAILLARSGGPRFIPLVLFEDPDMLDLPVAKLANVHLLNTTALLTALHRAGALPEGLDLIDRINASRRTPMRPIDEPARTKRLRSTYIRKRTPDA